MANYSVLRLTSRPQWLWMWKRVALSCVLTLILLAIVVPTTVHFTHHPDVPPAPPGSATTTPVSSEIPDSSTEVCIGSGYAQIGYTQTNNYGLQKFRCRNGECIANDLLCDGKADCRDLSDETEAECKRPEILCPNYAFRCNYGGCIDKDLVCNGVPNCVDNSDETQPQCSPNTTNTQPERPARRCRENEFKCDNGQCISSTAVCDGLRNCTDGSDETSKLCKSLPCYPTAFRCAYGACIDGDLRCNGVDNCADSSDEDQGLCSTGWPSFLSSVRPTTGTTRSWDTTWDTTRPSTEGTNVTETSGRIVERDEWGARPPSEPLKKINLPVSYVIICHTASNFCTTQSKCATEVRIMQDYQMENGFADISYNFLVGGDDGLAYVGRNWNYKGAHSSHYNGKSIGIAFIGNFTSVVPPKTQLNAAQKLIEFGVEAKKVASDYILLGNRQVVKSKSPGDALYNEIRNNWKNWSPCPPDPKDSCS